ncbi:MAG: hypothetical protein QOH74_979, partial [Gaiellales bacterium]|nr:hypothetical protein [Gaiellales bacterium]
MRNEMARPLRYLDSTRRVLKSTPEGLPEPTTKRGQVGVLVVGVVDSDD